jgi:hypothetical protein
MQLSCTAAVNATPQQIWPYYTEFNLRKSWEPALEELTFDGPLRTGTCGNMKLGGMPAPDFELVDVQEPHVLCDCTQIPGVGSLYFRFDLLEQGDQATTITHSVELKAAPGASIGDEQQADLLQTVFQAVPSDVARLKRIVEA